MNDRGLGRVSFPRIGGKQFVLSFGHGLAKTEVNKVYQVSAG